VRTQKIALVIVLLVTASAVAGCSHKLVGHNGEATVSVFATKDDFDKVTSMKSRGGAAGMLGGVGESMMAKRVAGNTHVKILSSDPEGDQIQILDGPEAGTRGYVAKDNVD
jgi:hypothetical protein